jgi:uncharacterized protein (TIGR03435 family)
MIPAQWTADIVNHLWQSTIFAAAAWLLTLALRRNHARARYRLWMLASVKFLIPFSTLVAAGGYFRSTIASPISRPSLSAAMEQIAQPFPQTAWTEFPSPTIAQPAVSAHPVRPWLFILAGLWACGALLVAGRWLRQWWRLRATVRAASAMPLTAQVPVLSSPSLLEPGIFGIVNPVLLVPAGIHNRLTALQLEAIVVHEMCHVRRRDNLTAAIHMLVEAAFWFHPMVWWIGTKLVEERERACDEAVLQSSCDAQAYAEGILNVCKTYLESPLPCLSGVTGASLKERIVRIMTEQTGRKLDWSRKLLLGVAAVIAVALPVTFGLVHATQVRAQSSPAGAATNIAAIWQGTLHSDRDQRVVVKITRAADGTLRATFYNLDGPPGGVPVMSTTLSGSLLKLDLPFGTYEGTVSPDGTSITGRWRQGPNPLPLTFARATRDTEWAIPQPPARMAPMASDANPVFEVATIKPSRPGEQGPRFLFEQRRFSVIHISVSNLLKFAYGLQQRQLAAVPDWVTSENYDISAEPDGEGEPSIKQWRSMVRGLMADRFQLKCHYEKRELTVYALTLAKTGPKLTRSQGDPAMLAGLGFGPPGNFGATNATMADFAEAMGQAVLDRPVVDQTGLTGRFDFRLTWTPDESQFSAVGGFKPTAMEGADVPPDLFTAVQQELGLKLESTKTSVDVLVIDHVEKPSAN